MYTFNFFIAGFVIHAETFHTRPKAICRDYIVNDTPSDIDICITEKDIDLDRIEYEAIFDIFDPWEGFLEVSTLCRLVTERLIDYDTILLHGATIAVDQKAYIFSAPSGTGKTTHILKWLKNLRQSTVVNGDKPFLKFEKNGTVNACGSPWAGKENMNTNKIVPLKSIVLMERAEENYIEQISFAEAFPKLLQQVYHPKDEGKMRKTLHLLQRLNTAVSFWRFQCNNFKDDCFEVAYNALVRKQS